MNVEKLWICCPFFWKTSLAIFCSWINDVTKLSVEIPGIPLKQIRSHRIHVSMWQLQNSKDKIGDGNKIRNSDYTAYRWKIANVTYIRVCNSGWIHPLDLGKISPDCGNSLSCIKLLFKLINVHGRFQAFHFPWIQCRILCVISFRGIFIERPLKPCPERHTQREREIRHA